MTTSAGSRARDDRSLWERRPGVAVIASLDGYAVHAIDGPIGEVIASDDVPGRGYVIAAGEPSPQGRRPSAGRIVMLPVGLIVRVVPKARAMLFDCTVTQIADAPAFENDRYQDAAYRAELDMHYGSPDAFGPSASG